MHRSAIHATSALLGLGVAAAATVVGLWLEFPMLFNALGIDGTHSTVGFVGFRPVYLPPQLPGAIVYLLTMPVIMAVGIKWLASARIDDAMGGARPVGWAAAIALGTTISLWNGAARIFGAEVLARVAGIPTYQLSSRQELEVTIVGAALGLASAGLWLYAPRFQDAGDRLVFLATACGLPIILAEAFGLFL